MRNFAIIGEAVKYIPKELRRKHKDVNWSDVVGMRNIITHEYFGVDLAIIWKTIKEKLPILKNKIKEMLKEYNEK